MNRSAKALATTLSRVNSYLHSFLPSTVKLWKRLPEHLVDAQLVENFRELILNLLTTPPIISYLTILIYRNYNYVTISVHLYPK